jgi:transposase IS66 family protein
MEKRTGIPEIPLENQTPTEKLLLDYIDRQQGMINDLIKDNEILKEEIKRLKEHKGKPRIKPSKMDKEDNTEGSNSKKRSGSQKRQKNKDMVIHKEKTLHVNELPEGSRFKGYQYYVVQDLVIRAVNTRYRLERWRLPDGSYREASLPDEIKGYHFGATLRSFIDYQYHHQGVTQLLLLDQLREYGVDISAGEVNRLLTEKKDIFHQEKREILSVGLSVSCYIHVDDTGARHQGKNGYCTHIGNELFAWFSSTGSKSRINFLELLQMGDQKYRVNTDGLNYMKTHQLPGIPFNLLREHPGEWMGLTDWERYLDKLAIKNKRHRQIATEGALTGHLLSKGFFKDIKIISDDAGQFNIFEHGLCWIHAERKINELIPLNEGHAKDIERIRSLFWEIYALLKKYKLTPHEIELKDEIEQKFDVLCATKTCYQLLNNVLKRLKQNKAELLLVLTYPEIPLHNNLSERDIREYVKKRKISGSTRSDNGKQCRDTFASLKKTCRKLKINFWHYLLDRHRKRPDVLWLPALIQQTALQG